MRQNINIYCDESCHLVSEEQSAMALGAVYCSLSKKQEIFERLRELKIKHNLVPRKKKSDKENRAYYELKWNKVSNSKIDYFKDVINYFFDDDDIKFRVLVVPDKSKLDYKKYNHNHDTFYYKMYFNMLKVILNPDFSHTIYIDIKDTKSSEKVHKLEKVLRNDKYDYAKEIIKKVQQVRSHEVELIELADLLTGAVSYINRGLTTSKAKNELIELIKRKTKYSLVKSTLVKEEKFNIFIWNPDANSNLL
jgi:Protein of unknown function (DUF3800)